MKNLYDKLRQAENLQNIKTILITDLPMEGSVAYENQDFFDTIKDKIIRCTQGNVLYINSNF